MNKTEVKHTQFISQMSGPTIVPLSDDLMQASRMTIDDLIELSEINLIVY